MSIQNDPAAKEDVLVDLEVTGICRLVDHDEEIVFFVGNVNAAVCAESEAPTCGTNAVIKLHFNLVKHGGPNLWLYHCMRPWQDLGTFGGKVK